MSGELFIFIFFGPVIIGFIIYRFWYFKTHNYMCDYCKHQIPMDPFHVPSRIIVLNMPRITCPKCGKTSFFDIVEK